MAFGQVWQPSASASHGRPGKKQSDLTSQQAFSKHIATPPVHGFAAINGAAKIGHAAWPCLYPYGPSMAVGVAPQTDSALMSLPGEIRNRIYLLAIVDSEYRIPVKTRSHKEPDILYVCKQIRLEALPVYYCENRFCIEIVAYDSTAELLWNRKLDLLRERYMVQTTGFHVHTLGNHPNWENLLTWLERYHGGQLGSGAGLFKHSLVGTMFRVVEQMIDLKWERVKKAVEEFRVDLADQNRIWGSTEG